MFVDAASELHQETGPSEANLFSGRCIVDNKRQASQANNTTS